MDISRKLKNLDIMIVDDDEWIRESLSIYFESEGCHISTHGMAEDGLSVLDRKKFDIIITDFKLPGMNGITFLKKIQTSHPHAIKILITAYPTEDIFSQAKKAGAQQLIPKPFTAETIVACLARLIADNNSDSDGGHGIERNRKVEHKFV